MLSIKQTIMNYEETLEYLYRQLPVFQQVGSAAYKPGLQNSEALDEYFGHPHRKFHTLHIAGTNGKGSVSHLLASILQLNGYKTGLYTSPHLVDFRERIRIDGQMIPRQEVIDFAEKHLAPTLHIHPSFFELTMMMAFNYFAEQQVDVAVVEVGLGGRLDSTNIITPDLCIITNISYDHVQMLGNTLPQIAREKAGIIKPKTPAVVGESSPETDPVFERKVLYTNLPEPEYMGDRKRIMSLLTFADKTEPSLWHLKDRLLENMDLQGEYQEKNLRTVLAAADILAFGRTAGVHLVLNASDMENAIVHTASRMDFHGRWERLCTDPAVIADIGHNAHGLKYNFAQLGHLLESGRYTHLVIVYGIVADKDLDAVFPLMPKDADYIFTNSSGKRALPAKELLERYLKFRASSGNAADNTGRAACIQSAGTVSEAVEKAFGLAGEIRASDPEARPLVYIGGSTFIVSEAIQAMQNR